MRLFNCNFKVMIEHERYLWASIPKDLSYMHTYCGPHRSRQVELFTFSYASAIHS